MANDASSRIDERYEVRGVLGAGASALVLDVDDPGRGRRALKVLLEGGDESLLRGEFGRLSRLDHDNLVRVHDLGRLAAPLSIGDRVLPRGALYLVLDHVAGVPPAEALAAGPEAERDLRLRRLADDLAAALEHLHGLGLVHHDVKPDNVLVADGRAILIDLGLAARLGSGQQRARGTPAYMAPEALVGGGDARVDLYGLGATLYQLAVGQPPFAGHGAALVRAILEQPVVLPEAPWLHTETAELIRRLLAKDPARRPLSARSVRAELARLRDDHEAVASLSAAVDLLPPTFCGRSAPLASLAAALAGSAGERVLVIAGDPGSGKTRLVQEALRRHRILFAAGRAAAVEVVEGDPRQLLALHELSGLGLDDLAVAIGDRLDQRARRRPQVLLLGHLEGDPLARRLAQVLSRSDSGESVVVVAEVDRGRQEGLELGSAEWIEVAPLDLAAVGTIAASMTGAVAPPELVERLHRLAAGNTAVVVELVRIWARRGVAALDEGGGQALVGLLARQRQARGATARLVDALAVWGEALSVEGLASLLETTADDLWPGLLELTREGLVTVEAGLVALPSSAHYDAWAAAVPAGERRRLQLRAAVLAADPLQRAEYLALAADPDDAQATPWRDLADAAASLEQRHEVPRALLLLEAARRVAGADGQQLALRLAELYVRTGRYEEALALLADDGGEAALLRAEALQRRGDYAQARSELEGLLPRLEGAARARAQALLGRLLLRQGELRGVLEVCAPAAAAARREGATRTTPSAEDAGVIEVVGLAHFYLGEVETADELFRWAEERLRGDPRTSLHARFRSMLGMVAFSSGRLQEAAECYQEALRGAERAGDAHAVATYVGNLGSARLELGEYQEALTQLTRAVRDLSRLARNAELASVLHNLGGLMLILGDLARVEELHGRAAQLAHRLGSRHVEGFVEWLAGDLARRRGEPTAALEALERAYRAFREVDAGREAVGARIASVEALLDLGRRERALQLLDALVPRAGGEQGELSGALAVARARVLAVLPSADTGDVQRTTEALAAHCARLEQRGARSELWRAAAVLGRLLGARGRRGAALQALRRARALREELMSKAPDLYREGLAADPDARSLEAQWKALVEAGPESTSELSSSGDSRPGWKPDEHRLRRLLAVNKRLNSELRLPYLLEMIVDTVIELTDAERGFLILVEEGPAEGEALLSIKLARNMDRRSLEGDERSVSRSIAERAARSGQPIVTYDAADDERFARLLSVSDLSLRSVLAVPLKVKGRVVGTIYVDHRLRRGAFGEPEVALVQDFADQAAIAIENARLLAENTARQGEIEALNQQLASQVATQADELREVKEELRSSKQVLGVRYDYGHIIGRTPRMLELFQLLDRVTDTELPVVVQGESGTGKELVARAIHENGQRAKRPFVSENCGAIPETLLESVLFGAVRGAFTGADRDRRGLFEVADGGTLFLDEVGEMSPGMQTKLLRVLQDGELRRVGGERSMHVDVRLIAASNRDLRELVERGTFREDLFFRLHVIRVELPALRQRREDIPLLVDHFLRKHGRDPRKLSRATLERLMGYDWPGNVRELENEIMRLAALAGEQIEPADLSPQIGGGAPLTLRDPDDLRLKPRVEHIERELIRRALDRTDGNQSQAARLLGLSRFGLLKKLKRYYPERYDG